MIRNTIIEIVVVILMVLISIPVWKSFDLTEYETVATTYSNKVYTQIEVSDISDYVLYQVADEVAILNLKPIEITLSNPSSATEEYNLYFVINKNSTLDFKMLKINYNEEIKSLNQILSYEDEEFYYFKLNSGNITNEVIKEEMLVWIDVNQNSDISDKFLNFSVINNVGQLL